MLHNTNGNNFLLPGNVYELSMINVEDHATQTLSDGKRINNNSNHNSIMAVRSGPQTREETSRFRARHGLCLALTLLVLMAQY